MAPSLPINSTPYTIDIINLPWAGVLLPWKKMFDTMKSLSVNTAGPGIQHTLTLRPLHAPHD